MAETIKQKIRKGLVLSAVELRDMHPNWTDAMIEDYLNRFDNIIFLADEIDKIVPVITEVTNSTHRAYFYGRNY